MKFKYLFNHVRRAFAGLFFAMNLISALMLLMGYAVISYLLLAWAGEAELIRAENFFYYLMVSGSTVGYGDYGPSTPLGKLAVSLWVIPAGISMFALILTRIGFYLTEFNNRESKRP